MVISYITCKLFQLVSAIPKDLIDDARRYHIVKTYCILSESSSQLSAADLSLDLLKMKNRSYYWLLKWERDLLPEKNTCKAIFLSCEKYLQR